MEGLGGVDMAKKCGDCINFEVIDGTIYGNCFLHETKLDKFNNCSYHSKIKETKAKKAKKKK